MRLLGRGKIFQKRILQEYIVFVWYHSLGDHQSLSSEIECAFALSSEQRPAGNVSRVCNPTLLVLLRLAQALEVPVAELLEETRERKEKPERPPAKR